MEMAHNRVSNFRWDSLIQPREANVTKGTSYDDVDFGSHLPTHTRTRKCFPNLCISLCHITYYVYEYHYYHYIGHRSKDHTSRAAFLGSTGDLFMRGTTELSIVRFVIRGENSQAVAYSAQPLCWSGWGISSPTIPMGAVRKDRDEIPWGWWLTECFTSPFILNNSVETAAPFNMVSHPRCSEPRN